VSFFYLIEKIGILRVEHDICAHSLGHFHPDRITIDRDDE
jgi:hypothetical protein